MDIKEEVYELLWELFKDECPFIVKYGEAYLWNQAEGMDRTLDMLDVNAQIWTILNEILPAAIKHNNIVYEYEHRKKIFIDGVYHIIDYLDLSGYSFIKDPHALLNIIDKNIFQAILSLLKAIESHGERDNLKFVWGE